MSGIGNTVETDLVGELCEVWTRRKLCAARGLIRAVTAGNGGVLNVWIEIVDDVGIRYANEWVGVDVHAVGDLVCVTITTDGGEYSVFLRLIKQ